MKRWWILALVLGLLTAFGGCDAITGGDEDDGGNGDGNGDGDGAAPFEVTGTSGDTVDMAGTWALFGGECFEMNEGQGALGPVTIDGTNLTQTVDNWLNSLTCEGDSDTTLTLALTVTVDKTVTGINWVDSEGVAGDPPAGLEDVTDANGMSLTMDSATAVPNTDAGATDWNDNAWCGATDWAAGTEQDVLQCMIDDYFGGTNPATDSWVVDDFSDALEWYSHSEGDNFDDEGYPLDVSNYDPYEKLE